MVWLRCLIHSRFISAQHDHWHACSRKTTCLALANNDLGGEASISPSLGQFLTVLLLRTSEYGEPSPVFGKTSGLSTYSLNIKAIDGLGNT